MAKKYRFAFKKLDVYRLAVEHFDWTCKTLDRIPNAPWKVTNQAVGASLSIMGNVGEANGRDQKPKEVEQHYRYAQGSTFESATHLDALSSLGAISDDEYNAEEERLARIAAMVSKLMQRQRRKAHKARQRRIQRRAAAAAKPRPNEKAAEPRSQPSPRTPRHPGTSTIESAQRAVAERSDAIEPPRRGVAERSDAIEPAQRAVASERSERRDRTSKPDQ